MHLMNMKSDVGILMKKLKIWLRLTLNQRIPSYIKMRVRMSMNIQVLNMNYKVA